MKDKSLILQSEPKNLPKNLCCKQSDWLVIVWTPTFSLKVKGRGSEKLKKGGGSMVQGQSS